jgi:PleD family two-component response regulator
MNLESWRQAADDALYAAKAAGRGRVVLAGEQLAPKTP